MLKIIDDNDPVVAQFLTNILSGDVMSIPEYRADIRTEDDVRNCRDLPLICMWNVDRRKRTFFISVNTKIMSILLESVCNRNDPKFNDRLNRVVEILSDVSRWRFVNISEYPNDFIAIFRRKKQMNY